MSNEETIICTFMDPAPVRGQDNKWWWLCDELGPGWGGWKPRETWTLDILREVEGRLTDEQWAEYRGWFMVEHQMDGAKSPFGTYLLHATVEQKIKALAAVIIRTV